MKKMVTRKNILYSIAAVKRMLGLSDHAVIVIREFGWVIWVWVKGLRPTFISKKAFKKHFVDRRKQEGKGLSVSEACDKSKFTVSNPVKNSSYEVSVSENAIACECEDFSNQINFFGQGACKHIYSVLHQLGFGSLKDYLNNVCF
jgi:predicted nucleic acid-binding Zn finger protein